MRPSLPTEQNRGVFGTSRCSQRPKRVKDSWNSVYKGSANAHRVAVLEEGMKFQAIGIPPEQAQFLETRKFQINEIARIQVYHPTW